MNSKKAVSKILGDYLDEAKFSYRLIYQKMMKEGVDLQYKNIQSTKEGLVWNGEAVPNPAIHELVASGTFYKKDSSTFWASDRQKAKALRKDVYRPFLFDQEQYLLTFKTGNVSKTLEVKEWSDLFNRKKESYSFLNLGVEFLEEMNKTQSFVLSIKIIKESPMRELMRDIFNPHWYIPKLLSPDQLFSEISLKDIRLERLKLYGIKIKAREATEEKLQSAIKSLSFTNFGIKDVLVLEAMEEAFKNPISNEQLLSEWPHGEAKVMAQWNKIIQGLLSQNKPLPVVR